MVNLIHNVHENYGKKLSVCTHKPLFIGRGQKKNCISKLMVYMFLLFILPFHLDSKAGEKIPLID